MVGCAFSDDERCPDGFEWDTELNYCVIEIDAGEDSGSGECEPGDGGIDGFGELCTDEGDCAGYTADYCLTDPRNPSAPGACTATGCEPCGCGEGNVCCDCAGATMDPFGDSICLEAGNAGELLAIGCNCQ